MEDVVSCPHLLPEARLPAAWAGAAWRFPRSPAAWCTTARLNPAGSVSMWQSYFQFINSILTVCLHQPGHLPFSKCLKSNQFIVCPREGQQEQEVTVTLTFDLPVSIWNHECQIQRNTHNFLNFPKKYVYNCFICCPHFSFIFTFCCNLPLSSKTLCMLNTCTHTHARTHTHTHTQHTHTHTHTHTGGVSTGLALYSPSA